MKDENYICNECGEIINADELDCEAHYEDRGECWGSRCREKVYIYSCPNCGSQDIEPYYDYLDEDEF